MTIQMNSSNLPTWLEAEQACKILNISLKTLKHRCLSNELNYKVVKSGKKSNYFIRSSSLSEYYQNKLLNNIDIETKTTYSEAPNWAKAQAEKYILIIKNTEHLKGAELLSFIQDWNTANPNLKTSYSCLMRMKQRYREFGILGLLAQYGKSKPVAFIQDEYFDYFKTFILLKAGLLFRVVGKTL